MAYSIDATLVWIHGRSPNWYSVLTSTLKSFKRRINWAQFHQQMKVTQHKSIRCRLRCYVVVKGLTLQPLDKSSPCRWWLRKIAGARGIPDNCRRNADDKSLRPSVCLDKYLPQVLPLLAIVDLRQPKKNCRYCKNCPWTPVFYLFI